ncbi:MAG: 16S rRNA (guanine(527)-N(7))-methyltransferase RsmG [Oscillospiraceae bacterium]|nr:16S rRNA (guanine(527)-N(7))-methyltransferase RsmG [Oscillospiraceae bacterium]
MIETDCLIKKCKEYDIYLSNDKANLMDRFAEMLVDWNQKINLTAIIDPEEIVDKHLVDSLLVLKALNIKENANLLDVGAGAGFPSTPMAIARDDLKITQIDSLNKRVVFLKEVAKILNLNITAIHARAEEYVKKDGQRQSFDFVVARAVAKLRCLVEYCLPFVKKEGFFIAMKGPDFESELEKANSAIKILGGSVERVAPFILPDESKRNIILIKKISHTPTIYPRSFAKISKSPL